MRMVNMMRFRLLYSKKKLLKKKNVKQFIIKIFFYKLFTRKDTFEILECKTWVPRTDWEGVNDDPSGRAQDVHICASSGKNNSSS